MFGATFYLRKSSVEPKEALLSTSRPRYRIAVRVQALLGREGTEARRGPKDQGQTGTARSDGTAGEGRDTREPQAHPPTQKTPAGRREGRWSTRCGQMA